MRRALVAALLLCAPLLALAAGEGQQLFAQAYELQKSGKLDEAVARYEEGLRLEPDNALARYYLGEAYRELKQPASARAQYERAVALDQDGKVAALAKARLDPTEGLPPAVQSLLRSISGSMLAISAGSFQMGDATRSGDADEQPVHAVSVRQFHLAKFPVTFEQYDAYTQLTGRKPVDDRGWGRGQRPAIGISWDAASAFVNWLNQQGGTHYRLPTEAEWEYAARAGDAPLPAVPAEASPSAAAAPADDEAEERTLPVAELPANAWGLHGMLGSVLEWVQDCYHDDYVGAPADGSAWLEGDCTARVARGSAGHHDPRGMRPSARHWHVTTFRSGVRGLRLAADD